MLLIGIILTFLLGFNFTILVSPGLSRWERVALSWVISLGLVTLLLFLFSVLNIRYSPGLFLGTLFFLNAVLWLPLRSKVKFIPAIKIFLKLPFSGINFFFKKLTTLEKVVTVALLILVIGSFIRAGYWPVYYWDALALYDYRAQLFTDAGGISQAVPLTSLALHGFPPMTSLAHTFVYVLGGKAANPQFIYAAFYLALITTFYVSLRKYCLRWFSLLMTLFLASIPFFMEFAANAYTNMPYAFYYGMGTVYLGRFLLEKEKGLLFIAAVLLGLAGWTRSPTEQFFLVNLIVLTIWVFRQRKYYWAPVLLTGVFLLFYIPWKIYIYYVLGITVVANEFAAALSAGASSPFNLGRLVEVTGLLFQSVKNVSGNSLILALLVTLFYPSQARKNFYILLFWVLTFFVFIVGSYAFSLSWHDWKDSIANSANRLSMFLPPFVLFYAAISVPRFLNHKPE